VQHRCCYGLPIFKKPEDYALVAMERSELVKVVVAEVAGFVDFLISLMVSIRVFHIITLIRPTTHLPTKVRLG